jgi:hypothetical protein
MRIKTLFLAAVAATLPLLAACDQPTSPSAAGQVVEQKSAPTSAIDPATGELTALNYHPVAPSFIDFIEPCTVEEPCEPPCDTSDPYGGCYVPPCSSLISGYTEYRAGTEPYSFLEVSGTTSSSCGYLVLTGIGARINGSDDYTTLHLRGRRINANGSWGETVNYRFGSSPNHTLEVWGEVPASSTDFYGIVGIGLGQGGTEDVRTLVVSYRKLELTSAGIRATGPTYQARFGANPYGVQDASYVSTTDNQVFVGAGFRSIDAGEKTATMAAYLGNLP